MDYWIAYFFALSTISFQSKTLAFEMTLNQNAENSQSLEIYMNMVNIVSSMSITRPDGSKGSCTAPILGIPGVCTTGLSQDLSTGVTTFTIGSVLRSRDQGVWTSSHGTEPGSINITVLTTPTLNVTNQPLSSLTLSSDASLNTHSLSAMVICAYPGVSLDLSFVPTTGGSAVSATLSTASCSLSSTTVCSDIEANSYNCTITPQKENNLSPGTKYYIQVTVNLDGQYQPIGLNSLITDTEIIVPANPTPNCDCTPEKVLLALSIVIMCIVLIHSWMVFFYTKGIINWNVPVISKCDDDKSPVNIFVVTIAITLFCVLGVVLCAVGLHISLKCTLEDNTSLILAIVGFVLVVVGLVVDILHVCLFKKKTAKSDQRDRPEGQEAKTLKSLDALPPIEDKSTNNSARSGSPTSTSKIRTKINKMNGQVSDSNESDGGETARSILGNVPVGRKLPPLQPGVEPSQPPEDTTGVKKLKKKKKKKNKEEQQNDKEDDNE